MKGYSILIVDDEKNILKSLGRVLMDENYHIVMAQSGEQGLSKLENYDADLIISDQNMPGMSGLEFLKKAKLKHPHIASIMLTAQADIEAVKKAVNEVGAYKFILKPWNEDDFRISVRRALELQELTMERDSLLEKIKTQEVLFRELERKHPGITRTGKDEDADRNMQSILIVDDEKSILKSVTRMLMDDDYQLHTALGGQEGLAKLKKHRVDLVISDQKMPGMTGLEFLRHVKAEYSDILTIMLTAYADIETAIDAVNEAGIYKFILKPWDEDDFRISIKRALELRQLVIERNLLAQEVP
ncbi:response regulator [Desulfococcaceae bacterium HSG8]|nr:response regulator [Desulfococcaceae bacterium HSG8]